MAIFKTYIFPRPVTLGLILVFISSSVVCEPEIQEQDAAIIGSDQTIRTGEFQYRFGDLVAMAVSSHPSIAASQAELNTSELQVDVARYQFYPTPSVTYGRAGGGTPSTVLALEQPLWTGGRLTSTLNATETRVLSRKAGVDLARFDLTIKLINLYQQWITSSGRIDVQKADIARLEKFWITIDSRIRNGVSAEADRKLVDSRLKQSHSALDSYSADERRVLAQLSQVVGTPIHIDSLHRVVEESVPDLSFSVEQIINNLYGHNPSLLQIDAEIEAAAHDQLTQKAELFPTVSLRAEQVFGGLRDDDQSIYLTVNYTPGAGLSSFSRIAASASQTESLRRNRDNLKRELAERIYQIYESHRSAQDQLKGLEEGLVATKEVLSSYERMFNAGRRGWLDVMNSARELTRIELLIKDLVAQFAAAHLLLQLYHDEPVTLQTSN